MPGYGASSFARAASVSVTTARAPFSSSFQPFLSSAGMLVPPRRSVVNSYSDRYPSG